MKFTSDQIVQIAKEFPKIGGAATAKKFKVTRAAIYFIVKKLRAEGVNVPKPPSWTTRPFCEAVEKLKGESNGR